MSQPWRGSGLIAAVLALWVASSSFYVLPEGHQDLVLRFGAPVRVDQKAGLKFKVPFIDDVQVYDARLQMLGSSPQEVILGDEKRLEVETYTRFSIVNPLRFYQSLRTDDQAELQLGQLVSTSLRRELGTVDLKSLLSNQRRDIVASVLHQVQAVATPLGLHVLEVRLHRADLPLATSQSIYARMRSSRHQEAEQLRAQGAEWAQEIEAEADRKRTEILSDAQRQSDIVRGEADAKAGLILGQAYARDPKFYRFFRSVRTYGNALAQSGATLVLTPDSAMLQDLRRGPPQGGR